MAIVVDVLWPDGRPLLFRLIDTAETREIVEALEAVQADQQGKLTAALTNGDLTVKLLPGFMLPANQSDPRPLDTRIAAQFAQ